MRRPRTLLALTRAATLATVMLATITLATIMLATIAASPALMAQPVTQPHITVELVPEYAAATPGKPFRVGLRIALEKDWHVYWRNPGDAGLATTLELTLPEGFTAGEIEWPAPSLFGDAPEISYGYHDTILLPVTITPPAAMTDGDVVTIGAKASWLVCNDVCIPGKAELSLAVPVASARDGEPSTHHAAFGATDGLVPRTARKIDMHALRVGDRYEIVVANAAQRMVPLPTDVHFFASEESVIDHSAPQPVEARDNAIVLTVPVSAYEEKPPTHLRGVLVSGKGWNGGGLPAITVDVPIAIEHEADPDGSSTKSRE